MAKSSSLGAMPQATARPATSASTVRLRSIRNLGTALLFLLPSLVIFVYFVFVPLLKTVQLSMFLADPLGRMKAFVGLENYQRVLSEPNLPNSLRVSFLFVLFVVPATLIVFFRLFGCVPWA